jgi:two-component system, NarL family, response regulator NreC
VCPHTQIPLHKTVRCLLVHDHLLLRQGLRRLLEDEPDMQVLDEASNAAEALQRIFHHRPDVVIADAQIFDAPPDETEDMIRKASPNTRVFYLIQGNGDRPGESLPTRPSFAARETSAAELVDMVRKSACAQTANHELPTIELAEPSLEESVPRKRVLTAREREVLKLLAEGRTVRSAAGVLGLSVKTVDAHKFNLMRKLGIHNKAQLVMWAIQKRVVKLPLSS